MGYKKIHLIQEIWELAYTSTNFSTRITHFKEYLQKKLEKEEGFYKEAVRTFLAKVSSLCDIHRREQNLLYKIQMKQINSCWSKRIKCLREMINELDFVEIKRGDLLFNLVDLMKELDGPNLLMDTILLSKKKLLEQIDVLQFAWAGEFLDSIKFSEEIERWLVTYINRNDEVDDMFHQLGIKTDILINISTYHTTQRGIKTFQTKINNHKFQDKASSEDRNGKIIKGKYNFFY